MCSSPTCPSASLRNSSTSRSPGSVQVLAPALHKYLIPCPPAEPCDRISTICSSAWSSAPCATTTERSAWYVTVEGMTTRLESERRVARELRNGSRQKGRRDPAPRRVRPRRRRRPIGTALGDDDWQYSGRRSRALASRRDAGSSHGDAALRNGLAISACSQCAPAPLPHRVDSPRRCVADGTRRPDCVSRQRSRSARSAGRSHRGVDRAFDVPMSTSVSMPSRPSSKAHPAAIDRLAATPPRVTSSWPFPPSKRWCASAIRSFASHYSRRC